MLVLSSSLRLFFWSGSTLLSLSSWLFLPLLFVVSSSLFLRGGALSIFLSVWWRDEKAARTTNEREEEGKSRHYTERGLRKLRQSRTKQRGRESTFVLPFCGDSMSPSLSMWWFLLYLSFFRGWFLTSLSLSFDGLCVSFLRRRTGNHHHHKRNREEEDGTTTTEKLEQRLCSSIFCVSFPFVVVAFLLFSVVLFCFVRQHTSICTHLLLASISRIVSSGSSLVFSHSFVFRARVCLTMTFCDIHLHGSRNNSLEKHRT